MRFTLPALPAALLALGLGAGSLAAQGPQERRGFWIGFGGGYGSAAVSCDGCIDTGRLESASGFLKLGTAVSQNLLLGVEANGWRKRSSGVTENLGNVSAVAYLYPWARGGLFVKGGGGLSTYIASGPGPDLTGTGWGLIAGVGYDLRVARNISLTPVANIYYGHLGSLVLGGNPVESGWQQNIVDVGLGITFH